MILIAGLGPAGLDRVEEGTRRRLLDPVLAVVVRTLQHPAAAELAGLRPVEPCDDLYESAADFDEVYGAIARRVLERAAPTPWNAACRCSTATVCPIRCSSTCLR
jgi:tetrapyrrole methylase family protein/MazG family protein